MCGVYFKFSFEFPDTPFGPFIPLLFPMIYCFIISTIVLHKIDKISNDNTINSEETTHRLKHVNDFHEKM